MAKTYSAKMHGNENASIQFNACILNVLDHVREGVGNLVDSRKADEYALGAIHALRKLCDGERLSAPLARSEVKEWEETFWAWFERVQKKLDPKIAKQLRANAADDFRVLNAAAADLPEYFWREDSLKRSIQITLPSGKQLQAAFSAAERKHPVSLGSALHNYLERCVAELIGGATKHQTEESAEVEEAGDRLAMSYMPGERGQHSLCVDDFACFETAEEREEDVSVTGYDVEEGVKKYLKKNAAAVSKKVQLDSESSLFSAQSKELAALAQVVEILCQFAADKELFAQYSPPEKR